ncbi:hypothetical protein [Robiginitalea sp. IMCC43444]|uniref:hypothetical protein n=1 Tax=Robiginitalea sp. IMCC43444 TaxID=3459121 RepID=UPI00404157CA
MRIIPYLLCLALVFSVSCGSSTKSASAGDGENIQKRLDRENSAVIPLITRIRRIPGIAVENGVPVFVKNNNSFQAGVTQEPLYVVDGLIIGNSYSRVRDVVQPVDVDKIVALSGADASFYGSRGSNGVIVITTRNGE